MAMLVCDGRQHDFDGACILGRHRDCGYVVHDGAASRRHSRVFRDEGAWWVEDMGSANGTRHNGERIEGRRRLSSGDAIRIGDAEIIFFASDATGPARGGGLDPASLEGRELRGYKIGPLIGRGGMGFVYRAEQESLRRNVAFKVFTRKVVEDDPQFAERFAELAGKAGSIQHDGFVQVHENGSDDGLMWYSMELAEGDTVERLLDREKRFDPVLALIIAERVAMALAEAHAHGVVHRDLNPASIILTPEGKVKVLDLGLGGILGRGRDRTKPAAVWYEAPELPARQPAHAADDAYSLGCILFHMLAGEPPYRGDSVEGVRVKHGGAEVPSVRKLRPELPAGCDAVIEGLLAKNREWRQHDLKACAGELRRLRDALGAAGQAHASNLAKGIVHVRQASAVQTASRAKSRLLIGAVVFLLVVAGAITLPVLMRAPAEVVVAPPPSTTPPAFAPPKQPFGLRPPPKVVPIEAETPVAPAVDWAPRLAQARTEVQARVADSDWAGAEAILDALAKAEGITPQASEQVRVARRQLDADADAWYQREVSRLPTDDAQGAMRLAAIARLRDQAPPASRADAEARWNEAKTLLAQQLNEASRKARQALERGKPGELNAIAAALEPAVAGTPLAGLHRQFADLCAEAAGVQALWTKDWKTTVSTFDRLRGERLLPAAAALLLAGDTARAQKMLADPALAQGAVLRRRESLRGRSAALLSFDDPGDLRFVDVVSGAPVLGGGALSGAADDPAILVCTVPVGGAEWQAETAVRLAAAGGELVLSCNLGDQQPLLVRISEGAAFLRLGTTERKLPLAVAGDHRLRVSARGGGLLVVVDGQTLATQEGVTLPAGCQLRIELAGAAWRLDELIAVGGG
jgi:hypothetical protein